MPGNHKRRQWRISFEEKKSGLQNAECYVFVSQFVRECAIKFNDYFEFPKELNMEPYTVQGLAKLEGKF